MALSHEKARRGNAGRDFNTVNKTSFNTPRAAIKPAILRISRIAPIASMILATGFNLARLSMPCWPK